MNPSPTGKRYTSVKNAHKMIIRGLAAIAGTNAIRLLSRASIFVADEGWSDRQIDAAIERNRNGIVFWNGCHRNGMHPPGHNVLIPRPDSGAR